MKLESSNEVGANAWKTNTDFGISIYEIYNMFILIQC